MSSQVHPGASGHDAPDLVSEILFSAPATRRAISRYGFAGAALAVAFSLRYLVHDELLYRLPFVFFVPATLIAAWYGGLGPGVAAMTGGLLLGDYFFLEPHDAWGPLSPAARMAIGGYTLSCLVGIGVIQVLHATNRRLERRIQDLRRLRDDRLR